MLHLITGGSGSGKSAYAEKQVLEAGAGRRIYLATMIPDGEEGRQRIARHRKLRAEKNFETVECRIGLETVTLPEGCLVLLEDLSNLTANEMFEEDGAHEKTVEAVLRGMETLQRQARQVFAVTNEVFSDGESYDPDTERYLTCLGEVNRRLAEQADRVTEIVYGIPVKIRDTSGGTE